MSQTNSGANSRAKQREPLDKCPKGKSYVEWQIGEPQVPQAIVSYSWELPWTILVDWLLENIGEDGVVWIDILAYNQHAIEAGDIEEIQLLPSVIAFIGQTYVIPGTLTRLWCISEMSYSLLHNKQIVYYDSDGANDPVAQRLLREDMSQLQLHASEFLRRASCFKSSDREFILRVMDQHFGSRTDAIVLVKAFVDSRITRSLRRATVVDDKSGAIKQVAGVGFLERLGATGSRVDAE